MNNPGIDIAIWEQLKKKWAQLDANGRALKVDFRLISADVTKDKTLAIDVVQTVNDEVYVETVQRNAGEAHKTLGIAGLSREELIRVYKKMLRELYGRIKKPNSDLIVEMTPHSDISGETTGYLQQPTTGKRYSIELNYQHYYVLNAIRAKMIELEGDRGSKIKAVYHAGNVEFHSDYQES
jgi:hypothetical protein